MTSTMAHDIEEAFSVLEKRLHPTWEIEGVQATAILRHHFTSLEEQLEALREQAKLDRTRALSAERLLNERDALEKRHADLLDLARRVSNSFIATQDRFGQERRKLLWQLHDAVGNSNPNEPEAL